MAFLQPDIVPAMAEGIHRQLGAAPGGRRKRETIIQDLLPKGIDSSRGRAVFTATLRELTSIGAIEEAEEQLALPADLPWARAPGTMPMLIRRRAMLAERESDLWEKDDGGALVLVGARDLVRAIAWFLNLDVQDGPFDFDGTTPAISDLQETQLGGERLILNVERWRPFVRWARYLGFSSGWVFGSQFAPAVMPDPTQAVSSVVIDLLSTSDWRPISEVIAALADALPVLDGGIYRGAILARGAPTVEADVSPSLSLALCRLQANGTIELTGGGGDAVALTFANGLGAFWGMRLAKESAA
jgi:hypothetical protein